MNVHILHLVSYLHTTFTFHIYSFPHHHLSFPTPQTETSLVMLAHASAHNWLLGSVYQLEAIVFGIFVHTVAQVGATPRHRTACLHDRIPVLGDAIENREWLIAMVLKKWACFDILGCTRQKKRVQHSRRQTGRSPWEREEASMTWLFSHLITLSRFNSSPSSTHFSPIAAMTLRQQIYGNDRIGVTIQAKRAGVYVCFNKNGKLVTRVSCNLEKNFSGKSASENVAPKLECKMSVRQK